MPGLVAGRSLTGVWPCRRSTLRLCGLSDQFLVCVGVDYPDDLNPEVELGLIHEGRSEYADDHPGVGRETVKLLGRA